MIQIRQNCFETNSSSSHSLVIKAGFDYYSSDVVYQEFKYMCEEVADKPGKYILKPWGHEFEDGYNRWPFQILDTFRKKLWYLYAHAPVREIPPKGRREWTRYQPEYYKVTNYLKKHLPWLEGVSWKYCGKWDKPHSEAYGFDGARAKAGLDWYNFLFDKDVVVICDGDEYDTWERLKQANLVRLPKGTKEYTYD